MIYWVFTLNKKVALRQFVLAVAILLGAVSYTEFYEEDRQEALDVMGTWFQFIYNWQWSHLISIINRLNSFTGYLCCSVTVVFFAAPCCMLLQVIRIKSTEMLPLPLILTSFLVSVQWFLFGLLASDTFLQIPNLIGAIFSGAQLLLFLIFPHKPKIPPTPNNEPPYSIFSNVMWIKSILNYSRRPFENIE